MPAAESVMIDGIRCFAPELARSCEDYPEEVFAKLASIEDRHFWFRSRNVILQNLVERYITGGPPRRFLEIGCGTGFVLKMLTRLPGFQCVGAEIHIEGARIAAARVPAAEIVQLDATALPFESCFEGVGAFDVIEHIEADEAVIQSVHRALVPGGHFFVTVPQHSLLWSCQDDFAGHKRRYSRAELLAKLRRSGFHIQYAGSFCSALFPLMLFMRLTKGRPADAEDRMARVMSEFNISAPINAVLRLLMRIDEWVIRAGGSLPFGGSLVVVACKAN